MKPSPALQETVVLIHGIYMSMPCMCLLGRRLRNAGYRSIYFSYSGVRTAARDNARALADLVRTLDTPVVHFVGHSLGGLLVRHLVVGTPDLPPGRVVTLGTPHQGSRVAQALNRSRLKFVLGRSVEQGLLGGIPPWPPCRELGSLAGTLNAGIGRLLTRLTPPADGTVTVAETRLEGMTDHVCLPVTHTGMLAAPAVAAQVRAFLAEGRFRRPGIPPS